MVSPLIQNKGTSNSLPSSLHPDRRSPQKQIILRNNARTLDEATMDDPGLSEV